MKKCVAAFSIFVWLCAALPAQKQDQACTDTPPNDGLDVNGKVLPEHREWVPGQCEDAISQRSSTAAVSARALARKPSKVAVKQFHLGVRDQQRGKARPALQHFVEAIRLDPGFVEAQIQLGVVYAEADQPEMALAAFTRASALDPNCAAAYTAKASALVLLRRPKEAEEAARPAVRLDPSSTAAHYMLGLALLMQEKITPEALAHLRVAAEKYPQARAYLADAQAALARKQIP